MRPIDADALVADLSKIRESLMCQYDKLRKGSYEKVLYYGKFTAINETIIDIERDAPTLDYVPKQQWISVKDDLPACVVSSVFVCYDDGFVGIADWSHDLLGNWWFYTDGEYDIDGITHWMPLPEPPKEEE